MSQTVHIPTPLRQYTDKLDAVQVSGATVAEALAQLTTTYPELKKHLYNEQGKLRHFVNIYVNDEDIRYLQKEQTPLGAADTISIIPSVAGGSPAVDELPALEQEEVARYSRHLILPEVGMEGQRKLKAASVLCVGAGGLGSPVLLYLAAAGIGRIGIVDFDVVDLSNLQRQVLHGTADIGRKKLDSARDAVKAINPHVQVDLHEVALSSQNALELFKPYDIIIDGTDNFPTRYLVNDACVLLGKPNAYGSIFRFEGQASVFATKGGPCYRCLYPEPPPPGLVPSCAEGGVLGVLPGIIGVIQATEAIKVILGAGEPLIGRFLIYDALKMKFRELKLRRDPECPVCGDNPTVKALIDYEQFCGLKPAAGAPASAAPAAVPAIEVEELKRRIDAGDDILVLDVREPHEVDIVRIEGTTVIPLGELPRRLDELDRTKDLLVHCKVGGRSAKAVALLREQGFDRAVNVAGGILAWVERIEPHKPKY
ncbi:molybdenum cofactor biosynthesis protein MoeB [Luteitalea sp. TBR-22]|uniref:molybdopterin-synthase adenylyltransferase MoeB n=1 Tax=Luteitalea sp. TBR-22 TaxID=2802971 RepID=UPI001AF41171|nr:molybdopterin-synthase adenylyltransferase MoeB [Luteitalea sp. TBR-22]BCS31634.1 molybdenum cofactor biosynthesis protein MoeB [Luteitalea sp. TBR-22]